MITLYTAVLIFKIQTGNKITSTKENKEAPLLAKTPKLENANKKQSERKYTSNINLLNKSFLSDRQYINTNKIMVFIVVGLTKGRLLENSFATKK